MTKLTKDVECMEMIRRNLYLNKIRPFIDQDLIKVLIGLRRSGKTILLSQIRVCRLACQRVHQYWSNRY